MNYTMHQAELGNIVAKSKNMSPTQLPVIRIKLFCSEFGKWFSHHHNP